MTSGCVSSGGVETINTLLNKIGKIHYLRSEEEQFAKIRITNDQLKKKLKILNLIV